MSLSGPHLPYQLHSELKILIAGPDPDHFHFCGKLTLCHEFRLEYFVGVQLREEINNIEHRGPHPASSVAPRQSPRCKIAFAPMNLSCLTETGSLLDIWSCLTAAIQVDQDDVFINKNPHITQTLESPA